MNKGFGISIQISLKFVSKGSIDITWTKTDLVHRRINAALGEMG